jgi:hypothetical protein
MMRHFLITLTALLLATETPLRAGESSSAPVKATVLDGKVAYLRVAQMDAGVPEEIALAQKALAATNKFEIAGTVLDLRFTDGGDAAAAKAAEDLFADKKLPLAILVNSETRGAAEMLAANLREARTGLVFGGMAGDLKPDIAVTIKAADERKYLANPYAALATNETHMVADTNQFAPFIDHTSEADLVREKIKDGDEDADALPPRPTEPQKPYIHDPVLGRAVDWIKALAELRVRRS